MAGAQVAAEKSMSIIDVLDDKNRQCFIYVCESGHLVAAVVGADPTMKCLTGKSTMFYLCLRQWAFSCCCPWGWRFLNREPGEDYKFCDIETPLQVQNL